MEGDTLTFIDEKPSFRPEDIERALAEAQFHCQRLAMLDQMIGRSREFLQKALKDRDSGGGGGGWGVGADEGDMAIWADDVAQQTYL